MERGHEQLHAPVHLDLEGERLWRGGEAQHLRPKSFAVLRALLARPAQVVTKDTLLQVVWPDTAVSDGVLTVCINELRRALGDSVQKPQYVETVPRRGYRWIGPPAGRPVGRDALLAQLHARLAQAQKGTRQVLLLRGEAGLGKTTVVDTWLAQIAAVPGLWQGRGQCLAAASEAYFPVLEALGQLGRGTDQLPLVTTLTRHAPHWLGQLPSLLDPATLDTVQRRTQGATPARMLREGAEVLEVLSAERLVVLVLEDLHWSDHATLALLESLAQRRTSAHLLLLGTYRPEARNVSDGPLATLLLALQLQGAVLPLEALTLEDVTAYLAGRGGTVPAGLAVALHRRTDGHPLFLASVVDTLVQQGALRQEAGHWELAQPLAVVETVVPETLRQLILHQYTLLPPQEQTLVAAASVLGPAGAFAALAAGLAADVEAVEACGVALQRQGHILRPAGETLWPDATVTTCYSFRHALYQQVIYAQVPLAQRQRLHQRLGARLEVAYGTQVRAHAAELVRHFTCGGDRAGAVRYGQLAAATALQRGAYYEALAVLRQGLEALQTLPETPARDQQELAYLLTLGPALIATQGVVAPAVQQNYTRAQVLSASVGTGEQQYHALDGLRQHAEASMAFALALPLAKAGLALAQELADTALLGQAHAGLGSVLYYQGALPRAQAHLVQGLQALEAAVWVESKASVTCRCLAAMCSWLLGYPDQACSTVQQALAQAEALADPAMFGWALIHATYVSYLCGDVATMQTHTAALEAHATAHGLAVCAPIAAGFRGWLAVQQRQDTAGLESIQQALAAYQTSGRRAGRLLMAILLAEGYGQVGQPAAGLAVLAPLAGRVTMEAERYRLQGVLLAAVGQAAAAEDCLHRALTLARRQRALSLELRVVLALARLAPAPERRASAQQQLAEVYGRFIEGFDTADLQAARACLDAAPFAAMERGRSHTRRHGLLSVKIGV